MEMNENEGIYQEEIQHHQEESYEQVSHNMQMTGNDGIG